MKALSCLSKFFGIHERWLRLVKNHGLKWSEQNNDMLIIDRLLKASDPDATFTWIKTVKKAVPSFTDFLNFMLATGLRFCEAIASWNLLVKLSKAGELETYYNPEKELLEHYRFRDVFLRRTKKAFISFVPSTMVKTISKGEPLSRDTIYCRLRRRDIPLKFSDIREVHASCLIKYLAQSEIDFLHGRVSGSVFMRNYFNVGWISDLKLRTFKGVNGMLEKVRLDG
jgi:hypothetical protein